MSRNKRITPSNRDQQELFNGIQEKMHGTATQGVTVQRFSGLMKPPFGASCRIVGTRAAKATWIASWGRAERQWHSSMCPITCGCAALGDADASSTRNSRLHQAK